MERSAFHKLFKTSGPAVLTVIHVQDFNQTRRNVEIALSEGAHGVFLINHGFSYKNLFPILKEIRSTFPYLWLGVNFLGVNGEHAFPELGGLAQEGIEIDAYWADNACIDEHSVVSNQTKADKIKKVRQSSGWQGLYFGGTAFKCQRHVKDSEVGKAASIAAHFMDVVTTSGVGTGIAASLEKISAMREGCGQAAMSIASGITPDNAAQYAPFVDAFLVATGISPPGDFYNLDREKLRALLSACRGFNLEVPRFSLTSKTQNAETPSEKSWYLSLIKPNTAGPKFAWLDPSSIYVDSQGLSDLISDLMSQVNEEFDMVCGIDAMGFPLGAAIAEKSGKGFLTVRKAGKLCVEVDQVTYECYAGPGKVMEMRKNAFAPGTRFLIVDQWIETGGTMQAAIDLIEGQRGVVKACAVIAIETKPKTIELCKKYKIVHVIPSALQAQFDDHTFLAANLEAN